MAKWLELVRGLRGIILLNSLLIGLSGAALFPVFGLFLVREFGASPLQVGIFFTLNSIIGIGGSQLIGHLSDKGMNRRLLVQVANLASVLGCLLFAWATSYLQVLIIGAVIMLVSSVALPQLFAIAGTVVKGDIAPLYQAALRAMISVAWIAGPPLAFILADLVGFRNLMLIAAVSYAFALLCALFLPGKAVLEQAKSTQIEVKSWLPWILALAFVFLFGANNMYIVSMPIYLAEILGWSQALPGYLMGLAAALEIPIMLAAGITAHRIGHARQMLFAALAGIVFYSLISFVAWQPIWFVAQIFNAILVGIGAGAGISYFQTLMAPRMGAASSLYNNAIKTGGLIGAALSGMIAQLFDYGMVFRVALVFCFIALLLFMVLAWLSSKPKVETQSSQAAG